MQKLSKHSVIISPWMLPILLIKYSMCRNKLGIAAWWKWPLISCHFALPNHKDATLALFCFKAVCRDVFFPLILKDVCTHYGKQEKWRKFLKRKKSPLIPKPKKNLLNIFWCIFLQNLWVRMHTYVYAIIYGL